MHKWFRRLLMGMGGAFAAMVVLFFAAIFVGEGSVLYDLLLGTVVAMICASPLLMLGIVVTGIGSLFQQNRKSRKEKRADMMASAIPDERRLHYILSRLSPEDRIYLEERLIEHEQQEYGIGDDGEMVSMDDLLNEFEEKSKRDW